jgi:hypothetical protein
LKTFLNLIYWLAVMGSALLAFIPGAAWMQTLGCVALGLLLPGALRIGRDAFKAVRAGPGLRSMFRGQPDLLAGECARSRDVLAGLAAAANAGRRSFWRQWGRLALETWAAADGLAFAEWIFLVTGVSFMGGMALAPALEVLLLGGLFLAVVAMTLLAAAAILALALDGVRRAWWAVLLAELVPTAWLTLLGVILVENFTYVVFGFGILTSAGALRSLYGSLISLAAGLIYAQRLKAWIPARQPTGTAEQRLLSGLGLGLVAVSLILAGWRFQPGLPGADLPSQAAAGGTAPNIILIGGDGLSSEHLSVYGYERDTTPNLKALAGAALVAENCYTNATNTYGSLAALFTSKWPAQTRVMYAPNILQGNDAVEHLPGILSKAGYRTVEFGTPEYVDAYAMNIQDGFDEVNQRSIQKGPLVRAWRDAGYKLAAYFIYKLDEKLTTRLRHAFYLDTLVNPFSVVKQPVSGLTDRQQMDNLLALLEQSTQPVFVHIHLLGTHGSKFEVSQAKYSLGQEQTEDWMTDFYDDAIRDFDGYIGELVAYLKANRQFDHTLLIVYSDHQTNYERGARIPLLMHFPGDQYAGTIPANTQNMDIAPTILDYLGLAIPDWMEGSSLLALEPDPKRPIFTAWVFGMALDEKGNWSLDPRQLHPPFYQFYAIDVLICGRWYGLDLPSNEMYIGDSVGHTAPCAANDMPSEAEARRIITNHLEKAGFDVSSLR